jgi:hypothetical protein
VHVFVREYRGKSWAESRVGGDLLYCVPVGASRCVGFVVTKDYEVAETHCNSSSSSFSRD